MKARECPYCHKEISRYKCSHYFFHGTNSPIRCNHCNSEVKLSTNEIKADGTLTASVEVTNTGMRDGTEIVQLYIHDKVASISRPVKELKGFQRIHLAKGESKTVYFDITDDKLQYYNNNYDTEEL